MLARRESPEWPPKQTAGISLLRTYWYRTLDRAIVDRLVVSCEAQTILQRAVRSL